MCTNRSRLASPSDPGSSVPVSYINSKTHLPQAHTHAHKHTRTNVCAYARTYTHTHTHAHTHTSPDRGTPSSVHRAFTPLLSLASHSSCASRMKSRGSFQCSGGITSGWGTSPWYSLDQDATKHEHFMAPIPADIQLRKSTLSELQSHLDSTIKDKEPLVE